MQVMIVRCPRCRKETPFEGNPYRPFCSERCRLIDLGKWASDAYRVPTRSPDEDEDGAPEPEKESSNG